MSADMMQGLGVGLIAGGAIEFYFGRGRYGALASFIVVGVGFAFMVFR